jgi:ribosomal protein L11 methyltransferase
MDYIEVSIAIDPFSEENSDIIVAEISDLGFESFVTDAPLLKAYIPLGAYSEKNLKTVLSGFSSEPFRISYTAQLIREQDWNTAWESDYEPVVVSRCTVKPSTAKNAPRTRYVITIDPQMSFGTAHHQTTRMMIGYLLEDADGIRGRKVLDMGCGSGILAILAAKLHAAEPVEGVDISARAVMASRHNASLNRVGSKARFVRGDASILGMGRYEVILANIFKNILIEDMRTYSNSLKLGGTLYLSGFFVSDIPDILEECGKDSLKIVSQKSEDGWAALKLEKINFAPR